MVKDKHIISKIDTFFQKNFDLWSTSPKTTVQFLTMNDRSVVLTDSINKKIRGVYPYKPRITPY